MIIFSKNNYKYFIGFLIAFIFIVLVYGNYNLKINIIETFDCDQSTKTGVIINTFSQAGGGSRSTTTALAAEGQSKQGCAALNS